MGTEKIASAFFCPHFSVSLLGELPILPRNCLTPIVATARVIFSILQK